MTNNTNKVSNTNTHTKTSFFNYFKVNKKTSNNSKNINGNCNGNNIDNSSVNVGSSEDVQGKR